MIDTNLTYEQETLLNDLLDEIAEEYVYMENLTPNEDELYVFTTELIDNLVIYTNKCKEIINKLDFDMFDDKNEFYPYNDWRDAAYAAIYDLIFGNVNLTEEIHERIHKLNTDKNR